MKNKKIIIVPFVIVITGIFILFNNMNKSYLTELSNDEKRIVAENAYMNFAWGFQYSGMAMFNDGTIYKWNFEGSNADYKVNSTEEHAQWILEHGTRVSKKVTEDDLKVIEQNINNLYGSINSKNTAYDAGSNYITVWDSNNKQIILKESGDYTGENKSNTSQKLISIINKYLK